MRKRRDENKAAIWIVAIFGLVLVASIFVQALAGGTTNGPSGDDPGTNSEASGDWKSALESEGKELLYLGRPTCSWCNKLRPSLDDLADRYDVEFVYVNTDQISEADLNSIFEQLDIDGEEFGTPYLVVVEKGKKVDEQVGYVEQTTLFQFLQKNALIAEDKTYEAK